MQNFQHCLHINTPDNIRQYRLKLITGDEISKQEIGNSAQAYDNFLRLVVFFSNSFKSKTLKMGKMTIEERVTAVAVLVSELLLLYPL